MPRYSEEFKEQALAEAVALLLLQKKAQAIWGAERTIDYETRPSDGN